MLCVQQLTFNKTLYYQEEVKGVHNFIFTIGLFMYVYLLSATAVDKERGGAKFFVIVI